MSQLSAEGVAAFIKFQKEVQPIIRDASNPFFKSKYVTLDSIIATVMPTLTANDLAIMHTTEYIIDDRTPLLCTRLYYKDGTFIQGNYPMLVKEKDNPQQLGSAMTYARRYAMMAFLGIAPEDDDGNAASGGNGRAQAGGANNASDAQIDFLAKMLEQKFGLETTEKQNDYLKENFKVGYEGLTSKVASAMIEKIKDTKGTPAKKGTKEPAPF